jgi:predicted phage-related endonuclease
MINYSELECKITEQGVLDIAVENVQSMDKEKYALVRKNYFGASDSSILCGVNLYKTMEELIAEKNCKYLTEEEKAIGEKPIVKKGYELEPLILDKASIELERTGHIGLLFKPEHMYKFKEVDGLSVNYDGVYLEENKRLIPVEAKLVSKYGEKYYNKDVTIKDAKSVDMRIEDDDLAKHIKRKALKFGIPAYYYTQVQQEIAGLNAPHGYLAAMFDESWTFKLYYIQRDDYVINKIYSRCENEITKIKRN